MDSRIRAEQPADHADQADQADQADVRRVVAAAFGDHGQDVAALVDQLRDSGRARASLVAEEQGRIVGHVMLSVSWVDAAERLAEVLVLSPLAVAPDRQRQGLGAALVAAALETGNALGSPAVFLEGDPDYYSRLGFRRASAYGFSRPSPRIPDAACQVVLLESHRDWMRGPLVYNDVFWHTDSVGLRGPRLAAAEESQRELP